MPESTASQNTCILKVNSSRKDPANTPSHNTPAYMTGDQMTLVIKSHSDLQIIQ